MDGSTDQRRLGQSPPTWIDVGRSATAALALAAAPLAQCETASLDPPGPAAPLFPGDLLLAGDRLLAASQFDDEAAPGAGAVHVFERTGAGWVHTAKLITSGAGEQDISGNAVAASGDTVFVGCQDCDVEAFIDGSVTVFELIAGAWTETAILRQGEPAAFDQFGCALAAEGDTLVVGALGDTTTTSSAGPTMEGAAYVFERSGGTWTEVQRLVASDAHAQDEFGNAVALSGDTLLVGAKAAASPNGAATGAVYVFERQGDTWVETGKLWGTGTQNFDSFGWDVALSGDVAVVGAPHEDAGRAYVFERAGGTWTEVLALAPELAVIGNLGHDVAVDGDRVAVLDAAILPVSENRALVLERSAAGWEVTYDLGAEVVTGTTIGRSLALDGGELALGVADPGVVAVLVLPPVVTLAGAPPSLSLAAGGSQVLDLAAGPCQAGSLYLVLGSLTGTAPGIDLGGPILPLVLDAYTLFTLLNPNVFPLGATPGVLDGAGAAAASFTLPPGLDPALAGTVLHHAAVVLDPATLAVDLATDPASLALAP